MVRSHRPFMSLAPFGGLSLFQEANDLFRNLRPARRQSTYPPTNIYGTEDELLVRAEVPGFAVDEVTIDFQDGVLTLSGERAGDEPLSFTRQFRIPFRVETESVEARMENGVLSLKLFRADADKPRRIPILKG